MIQSIGIIAFRKISCLVWILIHIIGHYNPSVRRIIDLVSHTTYVVCVNFIHKWRDLQFIVDSERQIVWETFHSNFYFILRVFARNLLRGNRRRNTFRTSFWCLAWDSNPGYLLDHGYFNYQIFLTWTRWSAHQRHVGFNPCHTTNATSDILHERILRSDYLRWLLRQ